MTSSVSRKRSPTELTAPTPSWRPQSPGSQHRVSSLPPSVFEAKRSFDRASLPVVKFRVLLARHKGGTMINNRPLSSTTPNAGVGSPCVGPSENRLT